MPENHPKLLQLTLAYAASASGKLEGETTKLDQEVSLINRGTRGIGAAAVLELARRGSDIAINGEVVDDDAEAVQARIEAFGRQCLVVPANISKHRRGPARRWKQLRKLLDAWNG